MDIDVEKITKDQTQNRHVEDEAGKQDVVGIFHIWPEKNVNGQQGPHHGIDKEDAGSSTDNQLQRE